MVETTVATHDIEIADLAGPHEVRGIYARWGKRFLDVFLVIIASPFVLPIILTLAFIVSRDGGSPFYCHDRIGRGGKLFRCWKIRTMVTDADARLEAYLENDLDARAEWDNTQKLRNDPRVTKAGRFLRRTSLDELPQLWNVLIGDMSLVGPRPMMPEQKKLYPGSAYYKLRPGVTGFWQISDRNDNDSSFALRAVHDTAYSRQISLSTDVGVLVATVRVVLRGTGC